MPDDIISLILETSKSFADRGFSIFERSLLTILALLCVAVALLLILLLLLLLPSASLELPLFVSLGFAVLVSSSYSKTKGRITPQSGLSSINSDWSCKKVFIFFSCSSFSGYSYFMKSCDCYYVLLFSWICCCCCCCCYGYCYNSISLVFNYFLRGVSNLNAESLLLLSIMS